MNLFFHILLFSVDADLPSIISIGFKFNLPIDQGINSVIFTKTDIISRMDFGTALSNYDRTCKYLFSIVSLNAKSFPGTIPAVNRTAAALFMSHLKSPLLVFVYSRNYDVIDGQPGILLTMSSFFGEMVFVLEFQDNDFITLDQTFRCCQDLGALDGRFTNGDILIIRNQQDFIQFDLVSFGFIHQVDFDRFAGSYFVLFSSGFKYSVNDAPPITQQLYIVPNLWSALQLKFTGFSFVKLQLRGFLLNNQNWFLTFPQYLLSNAAKDPAGNG
jgi:hypothetical protein